MVRSFIRGSISLLPSQVSLSYRVIKCSTCFARSYATLVDQVKIVGSSSNEQINKVDGQRPARRHKEWTALEKKVLNALIDKFGQNWVKIASQLVDRTPEECYRQWADKSPKVHFNRRRQPKPGRSYWSAEEKELLLTLIMRYGRRWTLISSKMRHRSPSACASAARREGFSAIKCDWTDPYIYPNRSRWTNEEIALLNRLIAKHGKNMSAIASEFSSRTFKSISNYTNYHLDKLPSMWDTDSEHFEKRSTYVLRWSRKEIEIINDVLYKFGRHWAKLGEKLPHRTLTAIRTYVQGHRYLFTSLQRVYKRQPPKWTVDEQRILCECVNKYGTDWRIISNYLPSRSPDACKRKYFDIRHKECVEQIILYNQAGSSTV